MHFPNDVWSFKVRVTSTVPDFEREDLLSYCGLMAVGLKPQALPLKPPTPFTTHHRQNTTHHNTTSHNHRRLITHLLRPRAHTLPPRNASASETKHRITMCNAATAMASPTLHTSAASPPRSALKKTPKAYGQPRHRSVHEGARHIKDCIKRATLLWELDGLDLSTNDSGNADDSDAGFEERPNYYHGTTHSKTKRSPHNDDAASSSKRRRSSLVDTDTDAGSRGIRFATTVDEQEMRKTTRRRPAAFDDQTVVLVKNATVPKNIIAGTIAKSGLFVMVAPETGKSKGIVHTIGMTKYGHPEIYLRTTDKGSDGAVHTINSLARKMLSSQCETKQEATVTLTKRHQRGKNAVTHWLLSPLEGEALDDANNRILVQAAIFYDRGVAVTEITENKRPTTVAPSPPASPTTATTTAPGAAHQKADTSTLRARMGYNSEPPAPAFPPVTASTRTAKTDAKSAVVLPARRSLAMYMAQRSNPRCTICDAPCNTQLCNRCCSVGKGSRVKGKSKSTSKGKTGKGKKLSGGNDCYSIFRRIARARDAICLPTLNSQESEESLNGFQEHEDHAPNTDEGGLAAVVLAEFGFERRQSFC